MDFVTELLAAIITGVVASLAVALYTRYRSGKKARRIAAQFPVAGSFLTVYEDTIDGKTAEVKEKLVLTQNGTHLEGRSIATGDERSFLFQAEIIVENQFLTGAYFDENPARRGMGTFFMEPTGTGDFEGVWAGYGGDQREVVSGRYRWRRAVEGLTVRQLGPNDQMHLPKAVAILGDGLGARYVSHEQLEAMLDGRAYDSGLFGAFVKEELVAVATAGEAGESLVEKVKHVTQRCGTIPPAFEFHTMGLVQSSAVSPAWRRKGIGSALLDARVHYLREQGYTAVMAISWISNRPESSQGVLESGGFELRCHLPLFWYDESIVVGFECPRCGSPCKCTGTLYLKSL